MRRKARRIDEPQAIGFSNPLNASSQGASRLYLRHVEFPTYDLPTQSDEIMARMFTHISDCGSGVYCLIFGRRIRSARSAEK
jgi:hypothetical protein